MTYPGRVIIIGRDPSGEHDVIIYAVTGRSPSSRARRLVHDGDGAVRTEVTDPEMLRGGNERLLLYHCLRPFPGGLAVSNGAQTDLIRETARNLAEEPASPSTGVAQSKEPPPPPAGEILRRAFRQPHLISGVDVTAYEPDAPAYTPRISGCLAGDAALAIVRRRPDGRPDRQHFPVPPETGRGRMLATYRGENCDPLPAFEGNPREVGLGEETPKMTAAAVYRALGPEDAGQDLRVGVAALFRHVRSGELEAAVINRTEETG